MFERMREDIAAIKSRDPAARSAIEIMLLYPGYKAIRMHRTANFFYRHGMFFLARYVSQRCVRKTNIEIHPAAKIGRRVFIDHGTGVVIGETAEVGDDCTIYQGVTLGGTGKQRGKRHPTVGSNVMIGAGAKLLGPLTIGDNTRIAAGAVVLQDIPADSTAVGVPARIVRLCGERVRQLDQTSVTDPVERQLCLLEIKVAKLESLISMSEGASKVNN